eukprot:UN19207
MKEINLMNDTVIKITENQLTKLRAENENIEKLTDLKVFIGDIQSKKLPEMLKTLQTIDKHASMLSQYNCLLSEDEYNTYSNARLGPKRINDAIEEIKTRILATEHMFRKELETAKSKNR